MVLNVRGNVAENDPGEAAENALLSLGLRGPIVSNPPSLGRLVVMLEIADDVVVAPGLEHVPNGGLGSSLGTDHFEVLAVPEHRGAGIFGMDAFWFAGDP